MALSDTKAAIGQVGELLKSQLAAPRTSANSVDVGRPEAAAAGAGPKFNLFLYQVGVDGFMGNQSLDEGQPEPLWLVLHYLLTAFDIDKQSDSTKAHELLGDGMLALQGLNYLEPPDTPPAEYKALVDNPEPLKISFDKSDAELLSKIMQNTDEKYRVSVAFQVRPVVIASAEPPSYAPLVRSVGPSDQGATVLPSLGPVLSGMDSERFEAGDSIEVLGPGLGSAVGWICLSDTCFAITAAPRGRLRTLIPQDTALSAGSYPVTARRELASGRRLHSNAVLGHLLPTLVSAVKDGALNPEGGGRFSGTLKLNGRRLGGKDDDIFVAFYGASGVALMLEATGSDAQLELSVVIDADHALPAGSYRIILRVNGEQAANSPEVEWS